MINPKEFDLNKYTSNSLKRYVPEVDFKYPKELWELHNDYPLAPDKTEIEREVLSEYWFKISDVYNIPIDNINKLVPNCFEKRKVCTLLWKLEHLLEATVKTKKKYIAY